MPHTKRLYSEMPKEELIEEMARLKKEAEIALREEKMSEYYILEAKFFIAQSYTMNPNEIIIGKEYYIYGEGEKLFHVNRLDGIMAWGIYEIGEEERAYPIAKLLLEPPNVHKHHHHHDHGHDHN